MNNIKNKIVKNIFLILLVIIPLFLFIVISVLFTDTSKVWIFPFNVEIWGTISEWVMIWVTGITAIFLIKTFKEQQRLTEIQNYGFKQKIMPRFEIESSIEYFDNKLDNSAISIVSLIIYVKNYNAYNVKISTDNKLVSDSFYFTLPEKCYKVIFKDDSVSIPYLRFNIDESILSIQKDYKSNKFVDDKLLYYRNKFRFDFTDFENTPYYQEIEIVANNKKDIKFNSTPVSPL